MQVFAVAAINRERKIGVTANVHGFRNEPSATAPASTTNTKYGIGKWWELNDRLPTESLSKFQLAQCNCQNKIRNRNVFS